MNKITFYTVATDKPNWRFMRNEVVASGLDGVQLDRCDVALASCAGVLRSILKTNMRLAFATFEPCVAFGVVDTAAPSFGTAFSTFDTHGQVPVNGAMYYRDVVRLSQYPRIGRVAHHWWRGCLDSSDILEADGVGRGSVFARSVANTFRDAALAYRCEVFDNAVMWNRAGAFAVPYAEASHYTDSHAQTRWRRRVTGTVADCGDSVFGALESMYQALELAYYWKSLQIRIAPASVWNLVVAAIVETKIIASQVKQAHNAGGSSGDAAQSEPVFRWGITWEPIIAAWEFGAEQAGDPLDKLLAVLEPHDEGGDQYIDMDALAPYVDMLVKILKRVSGTANADWYNPKSYANQQTSQSLKRLPDIIELSL